MGARIIETADKVNAEIARIYLRARPELVPALERCGSPIEQLFLVALASACEDTCGVYFGDYGVEKYGRTRYSHTVSPFVEDDVIVSNDDASFVVAQQHIVDADGHRYRADFAMVTMGIVRDDAPPVVAAKLVIELDGHEWHERSKEQATADKSRDRCLARQGWHVLRFTGQEVYADATNCVREAVETAARLTESRREWFTSLGTEPKRLKPNFPRLPRQEVEF